MAEGLRANELSPRYRADSMSCRGEREGIAFLPWSPFPGGATHAKDVGLRFAAFADVADAVGATPAGGDAGVAAALVPSDDSDSGGDPHGNHHVDCALNDAGVNERAPATLATTPEHTSMYQEDQPRSPLR